MVPSFLRDELRTLILEPKGGKVLLQYVMLKMLSSLQQDVIEAHFMWLGFQKDHGIT